jgi:outer membrane protein assembly factor BamB
MKFDNGNPDQYCRKLQAVNLLGGDPKKCPYDIPSSCYLPISCYQYCQPYGPNIHAGFVYWQTAADSGMIYAMPEKEHVKAFKYNLREKTVTESPVAHSDFKVPDGMPGGALSISANGNQDGIVWVSMPNQSDATDGIHRGSLVALDAKNLSLLWSDPCIFYFAKFNPPIVANGRVYLATFADPVADRNLARKPGALTPDGRCDGPDPSPVLRPLPEIKASDPERYRREMNLYLSLPVGFAWIIEYGLQ